MLPRLSVAYSLHYCQRCQLRSSLLSCYTRLARTDFFFPFLPSHRAACLQAWQAPSRQNSQIYSCDRTQDGGHDVHVLDPPEPVSEYG
jgi:hypothetical protein